MHSNGAGRNKAGCEHRNWTVGGHSHFTVRVVVLVATPLQLLLDGADELPGDGFVLLLHVLDACNTPHPHSHSSDSTELHSTCNCYVSDACNTPHSHSHTSDSTELHSTCITLTATRLTALSYTLHVTAMSDACNTPHPHSHSSDSTELHLSLIHI